MPGGDAHFLLTSLAHASRLAGSDADVEVEEDGPRVRVVRVVDGREVGSGRAASTATGSASTASGWSPTTAARDTRPR